MSIATTPIEGASFMSRITDSFRTLIGEKPTKALMVRGVKSSTRLATEARDLTRILRSMLAARDDVQLVSEQGFRREAAQPGREALMLVGSVACLSGGLVLRLQLLDGRSFRIVDEVETALGEDLARATRMLEEALSDLLAGQGGRKVRTCWG